MEAYSSYIYDVIMGFMAVHIIAFWAKTTTLRFLLQYKQGFK